MNVVFIQYIYCNVKGNIVYKSLYLYIFRGEN